jgi:hypothetical protein
MANNQPARPWKEIGTVDRAVRVVMYIGLAGFFAWWLISFHLQDVASVQPEVATGIYQFPYFHKGHWNYLTAEQASLAYWGNLLGYGWGIGAGAACWRVVSETRADSRRNKRADALHKPDDQDSAI